MPQAGNISKKSPSKTTRHDSKASKSTGVTNPANRYSAKLKTERVAKKQANKIIRSLNEAKEIKAGNKIGTSFDDFLTSF